MKFNPEIYIPIIGLFFVFKYENLKYLEYMGQINAYLIYQTLSLIFILS